MVLYYFYKKMYNVINYEYRWESMPSGKIMTISVCMIVKNEERVLARCLDSLSGLYDELIIVDTGSTDSTKHIAEKYTDKIFEFTWVNDFSAARNFAFSKATMEYIYSADADEVLNEENRARFKALKDNLIPEIEIVQMKYGNQLSNGTVYNFDEEYRPKLFKRLRSFTWIEPVHEMVRLDPVVYDSDIVITHLPENVHAKRDIGIFEGRLKKGENLSDRLWGMYARELFLAGEDEDFANAAKYFGALANSDVSEEMLQTACLVCTHAARVSGNSDEFFKYAIKLITGEGCSEICMEMGLWYEAKEDFDEAIVWFLNACSNSQPVIKLTSGGKDPLKHLIDIYEKIGDLEQARVCREELAKIDN